MKKYARIDGATVAEIVELPADVNIADAFHPSLIFVPATDDAQPGDEYVGGVFQRPAPPAPTPVDVQAQIDELERASMTNRGARELQLELMREKGASNGLQTDDAIAAKVPYFKKLLALDVQIRALRAQL